MTRKLDIKLPDIQKRAKGHVITETRRYKLITPLFGGGVEPGEADPITVVRATEVKGHLRFWWRAMRGALSPDLSDLKYREGKIWGDTDHVSAVQVVTEILSVGTPDPAFQVVKNQKGKFNVQPADSVAPYAAFPLLPEDSDKRKLGWRSNPVRLNVEFSLRISYPENEKGDVTDALWAWENLGGIGGRTRRGFGALSRLDKPDLQFESARMVAEDIRQRLIGLSPKPECLKQIPTLDSNVAFVITDPADNPIDAWKRLIQKLQQFRQARYKNKYGLSQWPEANEIRRLHELQPKLSEGKSRNDTVNRVPRAVFGLPIGFHMPHDSRIADTVKLLGGPMENGDEYVDRLASPLILRPIACSNGKAVGIALVLNAPTTPPDGLVLKSAFGTFSVSSKLTLDEARKIDPINGNTDVLAAFLDTL